ncbi:hypothetical protein O181_067652 [Austropuccinia psidii MF-1]|uniref:Uncharacterized protein n=1 Tax=Austropuccinia psidii MF-1 TaxID=1389203 RepID=A0A9Q3I5H6_9BASI|nr:hypothetical protein [Austropuccinia psidii MF-1]
MSHTLIYHRIQNVQLFHHHVGKGIGPDTPIPAWAHTPALADAHANATAPADAHANATAPADAHANATTPHPQCCAAGSTSVICKMTIPQRRSPFMDELVRSTPPYIKTG